MQNCRYLNRYASYTYTYMYTHKFGVFELVCACTNVSASVYMNSYMCV